MRIKVIWTVVLLAMLVGGVTALDFTNLTIPDFNNGKYTRYWFQDNDDFDGFGFGYSLVAPFTSILGPWFFVILWSAIIYRSYEKTGRVLMPFVLAILTGSVWGIVFPEEAIAVWTLLLFIGIPGIIISFLVERA